MASITLFISSEVIVPTLRRIIVFSAVKIRDGRINDPLGNEPETKSSDCMDNANKSSLGFDVIWQSIMSSPRISDKTKAGRRLLPDKSVKGKGVITISPFINLSKTHPPLGLTNLLPVRFGLQNGSICGLHLGDSIQPDHPICVPTPTIIACYFSTCCVSLMFPSLRFFSAKIHDYSDISKKIKRNIPLFNYSKLYLS